MNDNVLGSAPIGRLLCSFALPSITATLVSSLYNIVDQIFIGQGVGYLGNAATNVSYPLSTICLAISLLIGIGSASRFSICLGQGNTGKAARIAGNALMLLLAAGRACSICSSVNSFCTLSCVCSGPPVRSCPMPGSMPASY